MASLLSAFADDTDFDYGDVGKSVSDISFYIPAADAAPYRLPDAAADVRNVILLIGDGMGFEHVAMARTMAAGDDGLLYMEKMPVKGECTTHSTSAVTDSAAAGTALACGVKTKNGVIGLNTDGKVCQSILEAAGETGRKTALVVTSTISHATPASFASHVSGRSMEAEISAQMLANKVNVLLGGGRQYWIPQSAKSSKRGDDRNLIEEAQQMGYLFVADGEALSKAAGSHVLGLFQMSGLKTFSPEPSLPQMTQAAIRILTDAHENGGAGFFMMVEGSQIDWAGHANNTANCVRQTLLFDQAVKVAIDFAMQDGRTLVIATSDHETGGLARHEGGVQVDYQGSHGGGGACLRLRPGGGKIRGADGQHGYPQENRRAAGNQ